MVTRNASLLCASLAIAIYVPACGDDGGGSSKRVRPKPKRAPTATVVGPNKKGTFAVYRKIDDVAIQESMAGCTKTCKDAQVPQLCIDRCLVKKAWDLRHDYQSRNDAPRDPFHSFVLTSDQPADGAATGPPAAQNYCPDDTMVAPVLRQDPDRKIDPKKKRAFSYRSLKLTGIIARGTRRYALFTDSTGFSHIVTKGNCLGTEKVRVRDIGVGMVQLEAKGEDNTIKLVASIELHPTELGVDPTSDSTRQPDREPPPRSPPSGVLNRRRGSPSSAIPRRP